MVRQFIITLFLALLALPAAVMPIMGPMMGHQDMGVDSSMTEQMAIVENCHDMQMAFDQEPADKPNQHENRIQHQCIGCIGGQYVFTGIINAYEYQISHMPQMMEILVGTYFAPATPPPKA